MRLNAALALALVLSGCASQPDTIACTEPRPQVCTLEYAPTCAVMVSGEQKEYASPCNACADNLVAGYEPGACPE